MLKLKSGRDLSSGLTPHIFGLEDLARFGIDGGVSVLAFDPVQSLLAAGTDTGRVYVFGQPGVELKFDLCPGKAIIHMRIVRSQYLIIIDANNAVTVLSLEAKEVFSVFQADIPITAVESDPSLDWLFLGLDNGLTIVYDIDRGLKSPYRIGNLQMKAIPRGPVSPVMFIAMHPRSVQVLLIGYRNCAVVYSMADDNMFLVLQYEVPAGAPGGDLHPVHFQQSRLPRLTTGAWHPNGHHIVTAYEDGSIVFWDAKEGKLLQARTIDDTDVNEPRTGIFNTSDVSLQSVREPIYRIAWCCTANAEDTSLLVAGGERADMPLKGMTYMEFGPTPVVQITSYQAMGEHYAQPRRQRIYPVPVGADPVDFIMIPRSSPYYAGNMDPVAIVTVLSSGELYSIEFPSGAALPVASMFPPSLCWIQPRMSAFTIAAVRREQWVGMMYSRKKQPELLLSGGAPAPSRLRKFDIRNIIVTGHSDGTVRLWDASHGEIEDSQILDVSIADALNRGDDVRVSHISFAGQMGELSVACETGELVFYKYGLNKPASAEEIQRRISALQITDSDGRTPVILNLAARIDPKMKEGFLPVFALNPMRGPITAVKNSDIGFLAVGYQFGSLALVELRNMQLIYLEDMAGLGLIDSSAKRFPLRTTTANANQGVQLEIPTAIEFSLMVIEGDSYSSIVLSVGTNLGRLLTFRVVPANRGQHAVKFVGAAHLKSKVLSLLPIDTEYGVSAVATPNILQKLPQAVVISGAIVAVTEEEVRIIRPPKNKLNSKSFDDKVLVAGISLLRPGDTLVLVCVTTAGYIRVYSLPGLKELTSLSVQRYHDLRYAGRSIVSMNGDVLVGIGKNESALFNIWGKTFSNKTTNKNSEAATDLLYDALKRMPPRPAISTIQWMSGTKYISPADYDLLIGGPHRPKSKRQMEEERARREQRRLAATSMVHSSPGPSSSRAAASMYSGRQRPTTMYGQMTDEVNERGERLGFMSSQFSKLEDASEEYMKSISDFLDDQKRNATTAYFKNKFLG
ncbi:lethal giant larvae like, C-terminal-domain-containing protein [Lipomyces arxii]|uniref:lethal giant larvae like, C-terminal-domain-containing protein n=1 Tax=Lipomyces arxii TaxID=56418 RepID=UPI0034CE7C20